MTPYRTTGQNASILLLRPRLDSARPIIEGEFFSVKGVCNWSSQILRLLRAKSRTTGHPPVLGAAPAVLKTCDISLNPKYSTASALYSPTRSPTSRRHSLTLYTSSQVRYSALTPYGALQRSGVVPRHASVVDTACAFHVQDRCRSVPALTAGSLNSILRLETPKDPLDQLDMDAASIQSAIGTHITLGDGAFVEDLGHRDQKAQESRRLGLQGSTCLSTGPTGIQDNKSPYDNVQHGGIGPMQGQANHFTFAAPEKIEYGQKRYVNETRRLYGVLEGHLKKGDKQFILGDKFTLADIKTFPWVRRGNILGIDFASEFPTIRAWLDRIEARPDVQEGSKIPA
ncbi:hypothetical protein CVT26_009246 [Gymnopilus dilepis]|uniref:GST C-terminal domain-containing protein n=1 Tax=Gymnopilus dilepis TaxID=231916 RepID=A0A409YRQ4_9AGAR|nr:hypothetical protein CVT26_009246 [Gymnopilus dilepis]